MAADLGDLTALLAVARAGGFREEARVTGGSASSLSEAVRRLESGLGMRLLNRSTRSVAPTEAGARLIDRLTPALVEVEAALDVVNGFRGRPVGTLRLNVPVSAVRLVLPAIVPPFLAASPDYLDRRGRPDHPRELLTQDCLRGRFGSGSIPDWEFERDGEVVKVEPVGPLIVRIGAGTDQAVAAALPRQRRARTRARALVVPVHGPVSLLSEPALPSGAAAGLRRLHRRAAAMSASLPASWPAP